MQQMKSKNETREKLHILIHDACTSPVNAVNNPFANLLIAYSSPIYVNYSSGRRVCRMRHALHRNRAQQTITIIMIICQFMAQAHSLHDTSNGWTAHAALTTCLLLVLNRLQRCGHLLRVCGVNESSEKIEARRSGCTLHTAHRTGMHRSMRNNRID